MNPIRVMITDDHRLVIDGLQLMIKQQEDMHYTGCATNGKALLEQLETIETDIVLLDINMPELNGIETCRILQDRYPNIKVIALSMVSEASLVKLMIKHGAKGYLLKNAGQEEVLLAIRKVYSGETFYSQAIMQAILENNKGQAAPATHPFPSLSRREKQVLKLIVDEYTTNEIGEKLFISAGTVETHRRNLLVKLGVRNTAGLVRTCMEYNLLD